MELRRKFKKDWRNMIKLVFDGYDIDGIVLEQKSNVAYMMLSQAVLQTESKPESPKSTREWVSMSKLIEGFSSLELMRNEKIITPNGETEVSVAILNPTGGVVELDEDSFDLLTKLWDSYVENKLNLSHARQVVITKEFLRRAELS
jgi:hypothetical protein